MATLAVPRGTAGGGGGGGVAAAEATHYPLCRKSSGGHRLRCCVECRRMLVEWHLLRGADTVKRPTLRTAVLGGRVGGAVEILGWDRLR